MTSTAVASGYCADASPVIVGMSLDTLASLLLEFGADEAINLDGGGSTTMVVREKVVNRPSDTTGASGE